MYKAQKLYNEAKQNIEEWETKTPETNEEWQEYTAKHDKKYDPIRKLFYEEYEERHRCCPECGSTKYNTTLLGMALYLDNMNEYEDTNRCICLDCGNKHKYHDRQKENKT